MPSGVLTPPCAQFKKAVSLCRRRTKAKQLTTCSQIVPGTKGKATSKDQLTRVSQQTAKTMINLPA